MDVRWKGGQWLDERLADGQEEGKMLAIMDRWMDGQGAGKKEDGWMING